MTDSKITLWMNVTTSVNWRRPPVGIVRVEQALRDELAAIYGPQFRMCVWNGERFEEYRGGGPTSYCTKLDGDTRSREQVELPNLFPIVSRRKALALMAQAALSLTPSRFRTFVNGFLYRMRGVMLRIITTPRFSKWIKLRRRHYSSTRMEEVNPDTNQTPAASIFKKGDVLLSMGLDWNSNYYRQFYYMRKNGNVRVVTCCYDLIPVLYPQYCVSDVASSFASYFLDIADGSDLILCISEQSRVDLIRMLQTAGGATPPTHVFPLGDNVPISLSIEPSDTVKEVLSTPFILYVSTVERRKNHEVLYRAYHLLCAAGKRPDLPRLVFVGMAGWGVTELLKDIELDPTTKGLIVHLSNVTDEELADLYNAAEFCVFPSLYEGWGLPVGEALSLGKAVICSNRGSLPEVAMESARYIDPWNPNEWAEEIHRMATDEEWRSQWEKKARELYRARTWKDAAVSISEAIQSHIVDGQAFSEKDLVDSV